MSKFKDISLATIVRTLCLAFALFNQVLSACGHPMIPLDNAQMEQFLADCRRMGFNHQNLLTFFTLMPLAVSPELKCTDRGLVDALHKRLLPLIEEIKEISSDGT